MEIKGKRILITCREDDSRPFYFLIKDWMKYNEVAAYFIKASESGFKKNPSNESTYYAFKKNISLKVYMGHRTKRILRVGRKRYKTY